jgi:hypothetical protein
MAKGLHSGGSPVDDEPSVASPAPMAPGGNTAPGWYQLDPRVTTQSYWDGAQWTKKRRWRGTGWFEDALDPDAAAAGAFVAFGASVTNGASPRSSYLSPAAHSTSSGSSKRKRNRRRARPKD